MNLNYYGNKYLGDSDRAIRMYLAKKLAPYSLDGNRFVFFMAICRLPGLSQIDLVRITLFDKTVVARNIAKLIELGLAYRESDNDDRRLSHIYPTEKGKSVYIDAKKVIEDLNKYIYASLPIEAEKIETLLLDISLSARQLLHDEYNVDCIE